MELPGIKRILPLILTVLLLPSLLAVSARADEFYDNSIVNLLDYGFANNSNTNVITLSPDLPYVTFSYPNKASFNYIDVIFTASNPFSYVYFWNGSNGSSLTVYSLGSNLYRAFGSIPNDAIQNYTLEFGGLPSNSTFNFLSVKVSNGMIVNQDLLVNGKAWSGTKTCEFSSDVINGFSGVAPDLDCEILLVPMEWKQYDFLTVYFEHEAFSISSISADLSYLPIPYEVDYLEASATNNEFRYAITLDLRGLDRTGEIYPNIRIHCRIANSDVTTFEIINAVGYVVVEAPSEEATWFTRLHTWITNLGYDIGAYFNTLAGNISSYISNQTTSIGSWFSQQLSAVNSWGKSINDSIGAWGWDIFNSISTWGQKIVDAIAGTGDPSDIQSGIDSAVGELNQAGAALDAVQRPDIGKVDINIVAGLDPAGLSGFASIVSLFTGNSVIYTIMMMFVTLSLISYILFGKG